MGWLSAKKIAIAEKIHLTNARNAATTKHACTTKERNVPVSTYARMQKSRHQLISIQTRTGRAAKTVNCAQLVQSAEPNKTAAICQNTVMGFIHTVRWMYGWEMAKNARKRDAAILGNARKDQINVKSSLEKRQKLMKNAWKQRTTRQEETIAEIVAKCIW